MVMYMPILTEVEKRAFYFEMSTESILAENDHQRRRISGT